MCVIPRPYVGLAVARRTKTMRTDERASTDEEDGEEEDDAAPIMTPVEKTPEDKLLDELRAANPGRVIDAFRKMDDDLSGSIDEREFRNGILFLLPKQTERPTKEVIDALFKRIDTDNSTRIELKELDKVLRLGLVHGIELDSKLQAGGAGEIVLKAKTAIRTRTAEDLGPRATMKVDLAGKDIPPDEALRQALNENAVRVIDLFRDWDVNNDGMVSRKEFVQGVSLLGLPGGDVAATLFDTWDTDQSGKLDLRELNRVLRRGVEFAGAASLASRRLFAPLAMYRNTYVVKHTPRRNWSHRKVDGATNVVVHCKHGSDALLNGPLKSVQQAVSGEGRQQWRDATVLHPGSERGRTSPPVSSPRLAEELRSRGALSARMRREASSNSVGMEHGSSLSAVVGIKTTAAHQAHVIEVRKLLELKRRERSLVAQPATAQKPFVTRLFESPLTAGCVERPPLRPPAPPPTPRPASAPREEKRLRFAVPKRALSARRDVVFLDDTAIERVGGEIVGRRAIAQGSSP